MTGELVRYDAMCRAIDQAFEVDEVKDIRDKAMALEAYSRQARNTEAERRACEIRLRAERKAGELLSKMQFRQLARSICAGRWENKDDPKVSDQHELFPALQKRYPAARQSPGQEPEYVLLEHMTAEDVSFNVQRLRGEATAKQSHADKLEAWALSRGLIAA